MKGRKGSTDEGGVRSPMIMKWQGTLETGKHIKKIASGIDLLPTLADFAGIDFKAEKHLDGISLKPLLVEKNPNWPDRIIYNYWSGKTSLRSQKFRLDHQNKLFDMETDPGQNKDVSNEFPDVYKTMMKEKAEWIDNVASELNIEADRPFPIGHESVLQTQLPARDAIGNGNIKRSNRYHNSTYFTNWISTDDKIAFDVEVLNSGEYEVDLFYTCPKKDIGATIRLSFNKSELAFKLTEPFDSQLLIDRDIYLRMEGYVKEFNRVKMGTINLEKGKGELILQASDIPGSQVMDFRLLLLKRL